MTTARLGLAACAPFVLLLLVVASTNAADVVPSEEPRNCSETYLRYHQNHTMCKQEPACPVQVMGIDDNVKQLILKLHNHYRNFIAGGNETNMPPATNMLEMEWDDDLAKLAQAHANQCLFEHDCPACRSLDKFPDVGQNLCLDRTTRRNPQPDWESCVRRWYDEVTLFSNSSRTPFEFDLPTGHFTQMVWATTWKIGCGYTRYPSTEPPFEYDLLYTCDYGPGGNMVGGEMYEEGDACSSCPEGTCCGSSCEEQGVDTRFKRLCKSTTPDGPHASFKSDGLVWACLFNNETAESCETISDPADAFASKTLFSGGYLETVVESGHRVELTFKRAVKSPSSPFCINFEYAKGPSMAGDPMDSTLHLLLTSPALPLFQIDAEIGGDFAGFQTYSFSLDFRIPVQVGFSYSVPANSTAQYLKLYKLVVTEGACPQSF